MSDPPRDLAEVDPPPLDLAAFFKERQQAYDYENAPYEPTKETHKRMLGAARAYRLLRSKKLAASVTGWSTPFMNELIRRYPPFAELMQAVADELAGTVRRNLIDAALVGGSVPAMIHLDELLNAEEYQAAEAPAAPTFHMAVSTQIVQMTPAGSSQADLQAIAERGVTDIEVPFTIPGVTQANTPAWQRAAEPPVPDEEEDDLADLE